MYIRDLRKYSRQTGFRVVAGFLLLVFIVGDGLIYIFYGGQQALIGLLCLLGAMVPVLGVVIFLWIADWVVKRANRE
ncbi:MAG TPA: hypothetical protein VF813_11960 [Anaerolineaceae bacterium]